ncbi:hypothetical protein SSP24_78980 [Streptomyces spinoverrucosus]|uniref:Uncharacterized protein n=1 Tax=Streptomyces spinoverrucosus TaxID=284043 RepID=A0A4Y3VUB7_9ACTN|nr:hypothetical protein SSP24_78980 [Streptomyces spinoverrucosus]GHB97841.1 hypothetical protein GCM10010397_82960 [Streptomyces spinoverrucosus]
MASVAAPCAVAVLNAGQQKAGGRKGQQAGTRGLPSRLPQVSVTSDGQHNRPGSAPTVPASSERITMPAAAMPGPAGRPAAQGEPRLPGGAALPLSRRPR